MTAYFARMCFLAGAVIGGFLTALDVVLDWPFWGSFAASAVLYGGSWIVIEALTRRAARKRPPVVPRRSEP